MHIVATMMLSQLGLLRSGQRLSIIVRGVSDKVTAQADTTVASVKGTPQQPLRLIETRIVTAAMLDQFAQLTGDHNPVHQSPNGERLVHGALLNGLVAGVMGTSLPGPGTLVLRQAFEFRGRCVTDRPISVLVELENGTRRLTDARYECKQDGRLIFEGTARLMRTKR